jgi:selenide,water dikinase
MIKASGSEVEIALGDVPLLAGAAETAGRGILSSLQPQNLRLRRAIGQVDAVAEDPRFPLLFDPQTAGGLLASLPAGKAAACLFTLRSLGYEAATTIGRVLSPGEGLAPITLRR